MKPIVINSLEDLALAVALSNSAERREKRNAAPPEYRHFTNAEGDIVKTLPSETQSNLKHARTNAKAKR